MADSSGGEHREILGLAMMKSKMRTGGALPMPPAPPQIACAAVARNGAMVHASFEIVGGFPGILRPTAMPLAAARLASIVRARTSRHTAVAWFSWVQKIRDRRYPSRDRVLPARDR